MTHKEVGVEKIPEAGRAIRNFVVTQSIGDYVVIQTCNRAELYYLDSTSQSPDGFVFESGTEAFRHLLRVACGLESFVIGETEILNQIKKAFVLARKEKHCSRKLAKYFMNAIKVGRKARKLTKISVGKVSTVSLALEYVQDLLGDLTRKKFLVVGAGETGTKVARALKNMNVKKMLISNRNYYKALRLSREIAGSAYHLSRLKDLLRKVDVVFCATSAPHPILTKNKIEVAKQEIILVDLSVPRNVEESIRELENVKLISFRDLTEKSNRNMSERRKEIRKVEEIIDSELANRDNLRELYIHAERIRKKEVKKALRLLTTKDSEEVIEGLSKSLVKKLYYPLRKRATKIEITTRTAGKTRKK